MMASQTLKALSQQLEKKEISAVELATDCLTRAKALNPALNALITLDEEKTLLEAHTADALRAKGRQDPLLGMPIIHKDIFCQAGWKNSCGSKMLDNFISPYNAHMIEQCQIHGLVTLGRSNMDEFAMGSSNENSFYGPVHNPWNRDRVSGGSSGGSATAVAARIAPVATGTDTGGSIRLPASLCGVVGIKPTYGLVSRFGMVAFASSLDQAGIFTQTAEDCAYMLNAIVGFDPRDSTSLKREQEDYTRYLNRPLKGLKIGLPREYFAEGLTPEVAAVIEAAIVQFEMLGAKRVDISLPSTKVGIAAYYVIAPAEASSNLSRFDGVRYGHRASDYVDLVDLYEKSRAEGFGLEVKRRILTGTYVLSHGYYDAYYLQAQKIRRIIAEEFQKAFTECDVIMGPVSPTTAWKIGDKKNDPIAMYLQDAYTLGANLAGLPGMSVPAGFDTSHLPVGLQIIGHYFSEAQMLNIAHQFQQVTNWHTCQPPLSQ